jgi:uncharacterized membrane protein (UPF0127 family)
MMEYPIFHDRIGLLPLELKGYTFSVPDNAQNIYLRGTVFASGGAVDSITVNLYDASQCPPTDSAGRIDISSCTLLLSRDYSTGQEIVKSIPHGGTFYLYLEDSSSFFNKIVSGNIYAEYLPNGAHNTSSGYSKTTVTVNNFHLTADLVTTDVQQAKGLTIKDHLNENEGMLFVYQQPAEHPIWMKDMKFPIDLIWMDSNGVVTHIEHNVQPCIPGLACPTYTPGSNNSLYVLGTAAGFSQRHNVEVRTHVDFHLT